LLGRIDIVTNLLHLIPFPTYAINIFKRECIDKVKELNKY